MEILLTILATIVLIASIAQTHNNGASIKPEDLPSFGDNQGTQPETSQPTSTPTSIMVHTAMPSPKPQANPNIDEYVYPGSKTLASGSQNLTLTSNDDPAKITTWYKAKIQSLNLNVNSFVATQANDKVLNKLVGDDGKISISIEVTRDSANVPVNITIGITSK